MPSILFSLILLFCSIALSPLYSLSLKERMQKGKAGEYIVTQQERNYTLLLLRQVTASSLLLEEITVPVQKIDRSDISWDQWVKKLAPGHTSWVQYEINLEDNTLKESYSFTKREWVFADKSDYLFTSLLSLPLSRVPSAERRRIGPPPLSGESDHRPLWNPSLIVLGKKREKPLFEVYKTRWPHDGSLVDGCEIELYFDAHNPSFSFPFWIEIKGVHYTAKIPIVDSGKDLVSPRPNIPLRPPQFVGKAYKEGSSLCLKLKCPSYYKELHLFAIDETGAARGNIPIPHEMQRMGKEDILLKVATKDLSSLLIDYHRYLWVVIPESAAHIYAESDDSFLWKEQL